MARRRGAGGRTIRRVGERPRLKLSARWIGFVAILGGGTRGRVGVGGVEVAGGLVQLIFMGVRAIMDEWMSEGGFSFFLGSFFFFFWNWFVGKATIS